MSVTNAKQAIRTKMKAILSNLSKEIMEVQSSHITHQIIRMPEFTQSTRIGLYLSMPEEIRTDDLVRHVLITGKECFVPRYSSSVMQMVKLKSIEDFNNMPKNKWNIRQPLLTEIREDAYENGGLDLIVTPGLAFTKDGKRLGRGKGYYDRYLSEMKLFRENNGLKLITIGVAFSEQVLDDIPTMQNDFHLDSVVYKTVN